jgi:hypothetical protein
MRRALNLTPRTRPATGRTGLTFALRPITLLLTIGSLPLPPRTLCTG